MPNFVRTKRFVYIALGVLLLGLAVLVASRLFTPARPSVSEAERPGVVGRILEFVTEGLPEEITPVTGRPGDEIVGAPEERLTRLTDFAAVSPSLNEAGDKILVYKKSGGDLIAIDPETRTQEKISNITIVGILEAVWSPRRDRAAVFYLDEETKKGFLHIGTSSVAVLPQNIKSAAWSPGGNSLAYLIADGDRLALAVADSSGKNARVEFRTSILDAGIRWITGERIAFSSAPSGFAEGYLFALTRSGGAFQKIIGPAFGLMTKFSPAGTKLLVSSTDSAGRNPLTEIRDPSGKTLLILTPSTLPEKCAWAGDNKLYCAVPNAVPASAVWPDSYLSGEFNSSDKIVIFDLANGKTKEISPEGNFDISDPLVAQDEKALFFVNRVDGTLWSLRLDR